MPTTSAMPISSRRRSRSRTAPMSASTVTTAAATKTICTIVTSSTASGYAEKDEREGEGDHGCGQGLEGMLGFLRERIGRDRDRRSVQELDAAGYGTCPASHEPYGRRETPLSMAQECGKRGGEHRLDANRLGSGKVRGQYRERATREREPRIAVQAAAEELEVVRDRDERSNSDEGEQPEVRAQRYGDADPCCGGKRGDGEHDECPCRDPGRERSAVELVERMRADAHAEEEREECESEHSGSPLRSQRRADCDVRQMPQRVRRVQKRDVVAPPTRREGIEGRSDVAPGHARRPQVTIPPPRLRRCELTSAIPAVRQSSTSRGSGHSA